MDEKDKEKRNKAARRLIVLLDELVFLNQEHCSGDNLDRVNSCLHGGEWKIGLDFFVGMWLRTDKPALCAKSCNIITKAAGMMNLDLDRYITDLSAKSLWTPVK